ncbi:hypothetical protein [Vibrio parahaemolyticus]|uniref:hypothetical protein n=1 Tax=Vibrio parahaemolyticus TaxID=670 RepID=UPI000812DCDC|nr:hypothetical protein [Vibrio parahaemolyticus]OCP68313.1 hypothetical protein AKH08_15985 [Vibrio parahaemolyticus]
MDTEKLQNRLDAVKLKLKALIDKQITTFGANDNLVSDSFAACSIYSQFFNDYKNDSSIVSDEIFTSQFNKATQLLDLVEPEL